MLHDGWIEARDGNGAPKQSHFIGTKKAMIGTSWTLHSYKSGIVSVLVIFTRLPTFWFCHDLLPLSSLMAMNCSYYCARTYRRAINVHTYACNDAKRIERRASWRAGLDVMKRDLLIFLYEICVCRYPLSYACRFGLNSPTLSMLQNAWTKEDTSVLG